VGARWFSRLSSANTGAIEHAGIAKPELVRSVLGGAAGGPLVRNRAVFFANYEGRLDRSESTVIRSVPTEAFRNGTIRYLNTSDGMSEVSAA
jgi:hypothetical protein